MVAWLTDAGWGCHHPRCNRNWKRYRRVNAACIRRPSRGPCHPRRRRPRPAAGRARRPRRPWPGSASSPSSSTAPARSARSTSPTWAPRSSRSRTPAPAATSRATSRPDGSGTDSLFFEAFNRGKQSIALDLKSAAGRAVFERLVATSDAVFSNLRGDQPERLGLTYDGPGPHQPGHRLRRTDGLRTQRRRCPAARLRRAHPGRVRLGVPDRRAGWTADQERPVAGRLHRRPDRGPGADGGAVRREADRPRARRGHEPLRLGARDAELPRDLVPLQRLRDRAPVDVRPSERGPVPVLRDGRRPHRDRHAQGEVLPGDGGRDGPRRARRRPAFHRFRGAPGTPRRVARDPVGPVRGASRRPTG